MEKKVISLKEALSDRENLVLICVPKDTLVSGTPLFRTEKVSVGNVLKELDAYRVDGTDLATQIDCCNLGIRLEVLADKLYDAAVEANNPDLWNLACEDTGLDVARKIKERIREGETLTEFEIQYIENNLA